MNIARNTHNEVIIEIMLTLTCLLYRFLSYRAPCFCPIMTNCYCYLIQIDGPHHTSKIIGCICDDRSLPIIVVISTFVLVYIVGIVTVLYGCAWWGVHTDTYLATRVTMYSYKISGYIYMDMSGSTRVYLDKCVRCMTSTYRINVLCLSTVHTTNDARHPHCLDDFCHLKVGGGGSDCLWWK